MDYDGIDYDEGYSMIDIDNNWSNSNMEYDETDSDSDNEIVDNNYNSSTNNQSILTGDKINRQTNKHNDSFLDRINKKLESLEAIERSVIVERKNDSSFCCIILLCFQKIFVGLINFVEPKFTIPHTIFLG